jgi:ATP-dependent RNA helicase DDX27
VTLVGEGDRKILKAAIKHSNGQDQIRHRVIAPDVMQKWTKKLEELKNDVREILREEKEEKEVSNEDRRSHIEV